MSDKPKLGLRQSTIRSRLAELGAADGSDQGKAEIDTLAVEYGSNETRLRAFMVANDTPVEISMTREGKERAELYRSADVGDLVEAEASISDTKRAYYDALSRRNAALRALARGREE